MPPAKAPRPIGLISAVPFESADLHAALTSPRSPRNGFVSGKLDGVPCVLVSCGIGMTNAAHAATVMIESFAPQSIVLFGIGGAYHGSGLGVGDVAVATEEVYADMGVLAPGGFMDMREMGFPVFNTGRKKFYNVIPTHKGMARRALLCSGPWGRMQAGRFLTVSAATGTLKRASELLGRYGRALCENMEGAAVAHVCELYRMPMAEVRGISNMVEDRNLKKWDKVTAASRVQLAVRALLGGG